MKKILRVKLHFYRTSILKTYIYFEAFSIEYTKTLSVNMAFGRVKSWLTARKHSVERKEYLNDYHGEMAS